MFVFLIMINAYVPDVLFQFAAYLDITLGEVEMLMNLVPRPIQDYVLKVDEEESAELLEDNF